MSDALNPVSNPDLVAAIQKAREDSTAEAWADMVREAAKARFITPVDISPLVGGEGGVRLLKGEHILQPVCAGGPGKPPEVLHGVYRLG